MEIENLGDVVGLACIRGLSYRHGSEISLIAGAGGLRHWVLELFARLLIFVDWVVRVIVLICCLNVDLHFVATLLEDSSAFLLFSRGSRIRSARLITGWCYFLMLCQLKAGFLRLRLYFRV